MDAAPPTAFRTPHREQLLASIAGIRETLAANALESERLRTLAPAAVEALDAAGVFACRLPEELGGSAVDPLTYLELVREIARIDGSAGWSAMIGATTAWMSLIMLPEAGLAQVYTAGRPPRFAGVLGPVGRASAVEGGYRISGRWAFASGIRHAEYVTAVCVDAEAGFPHAVSVVFPVGEVTVHDTWNVQGLKGTGSCDFSVEDAFVSAAMAWRRPENRPLRGAPGCYFADVANEHAAFAIGTAQRALDEIIAASGTRKRWVTGDTALSDRSGFQGDLGRAALKLRAAEALMVELVGSAWARVCAGERIGPTTGIELRAAAVHATDVATEVIAMAYRYGGGAALYETSPLQSCLRDIYAAAQHQFVAEGVYELYGRDVMKSEGIAEA